MLRPAQASTNLPSTACCLPGISSREMMALAARPSRRVFQFYRAQLADLAGVIGRHEGLIRPARKH